MVHLINMDGFVLHFIIHSNKEIDYILKCIEILGNTIHKYIQYYEHKCTDNKWYHKTNDVTKTYVPKFVNNIFNEMVLISSL